MGVFVAPVARHPIGMGTFVRGVFFVLVPCHRSGMGMELTTLCSDFFCSLPGQLCSYNGMRS
jgi:hypothetical protein